MSEIINSISVCFSKFATFEGRASRSEFWWFFLFTWLISQIVSITTNINIIAHPEIKEITEMLVILGNLILSIPVFACGSRRLHDVGKSGWWQLIMITVIGFIPLVIWWGKKGSDEQNKYDLIDSQS
jgi:uncharacterized membrane protein YhaH (DUF805 family)